jgi:hypothetical protein
MPVYRSLDSDSSIWRPTAHFSIDSRELSSDTLQAFEDSLYGSDDSEPTLPTIDEIITLLTGTEVETLVADFIATS